MNDLISALPRTENRARILLEIALVLVTLALAISGFLYAGVRVVAGPVGVLLAVMMIWLLLRGSGATGLQTGLAVRPGPLTRCEVSQAKGGIRHEFTLEPDGMAHCAYRIHCGEQIYGTGIN